MDYEKAYKAVLQTAKQWLKDGCTDRERICLECVFPELRESEDERMEMLKALIESEDSIVFSPGKKERWIAWLEKQKELDKKIIEKANAYDEALRIATDSFNDTDKHVKATLRRIFPSLSCITAERQKEDTAPNSNELIALWDTEKKKLNENCCGDWWGLARNAFMDGFKLGLKERQKEHVPENEESGTRKEQKPDSLTKYVYSKEDEKFIQDCANILVANDFAISAERLLSMFKQKPAWSKEDELMRKRCIADLGYLIAYEPQYKERYDEQIAWLKSLRPSWKPSEEQMRTLGDYIDGEEISEYDMEEIVRLYNDLKKL